MLNKPGGRALTRHQDLTGLRTGRLVVVRMERDEPHDECVGKIRWVCQCDCGKVVRLSAGQAKQNRSCGCHAHPVTCAEDLTGRLFGRWTAEARAKGSWLCRCACGNTRVIAPAKLLGGASKSCGCLSAEAAFSKSPRPKRQKPRPWYLPDVRNKYAE